MGRQINQILPLLPLLFILTLFLYGIYGRFLQSKIVTDYGVTTGELLDLGYNTGTAVASGSYEFKLEGVTYTGSIPRSRVCGERAVYDKNRDDRYVIVYFRPNPEINEILTSEALYNKYEIPFGEEDENMLRLYFICD